MNITSNVNQLNLVGYFIKAVLIKKEKVYFNKPWSCKIQASKMLIFILFEKDSVTLTNAYEQKANFTLSANLSDLFQVMSNKNFMTIIRLFTFGKLKISGNLFKGLSLLKIFGVI